MTGDAIAALRADRETVLDIGSRLTGADWAAGPRGPAEGVLSGGSAADGLARLVVGPGQRGLEAGG